MEVYAVELRRGQRLLTALLLFGICSILFLATVDTTLVLVVPAVLIVVAVAVFLLRRPLINVFVLIASLFFTSGYSEGISAIELLHGSYVLAFLGVWFADRLLTSQSIVRFPAERAFLTFLLVLPFTLVLTVLFDGSLREYAGELFAMAHFALYFPIRDTCSRSVRGSNVVLAGFLVLTTLIALRNGFEYVDKLLQATLSWQVERARVIENDGVLMTATLFFTAIGAMAPTRRWRVAGLAGAFVTGLGLVITQSRAFWVTFFVGLVLMLILLPAADRKRFLRTAALGFVALVGLALATLNADQVLIIGGLLNRFASLGSAVSSDLSLINRFFESRAVWSQIAQNPVVGHGAGVGYLFFDITRHATDTDSFVHNAYLGLWYKWGLWGLTLVVFFWASTVVSGLRALGDVTLPQWRRIGLTGAVVAAAVYSIPANTSNPFILNDTIFLFALLWGVIRGNAAASTVIAGEH